MGPKKKQETDKTRIKNLKCPYYDRGFCKFGVECFNKHPDKVCESQNCSGEECDKRHPNPCKFGTRCKYNRTKVCSYLHVTFVPDDHKIDALAKKFENKFEVLENQLKDMQKNLENKDLEIENIKKMYVVLEISFKEIQKENREIEERVSEIAHHKAKDMENKCKAEVQAIKVKADEHEKLASILENRIAKNSKQIYIIWNGNDPEEDLEKEVNEVDKNIEIQHETNDNTTEELLDQTFMKPSAGFNCNECNFVANNKSGLKNHRKSKHTKN